MTEQEKIYKIGESSLPLISGHKGSCPKHYDEELKKIVIDMREESATDNIRYQIDTWMNENNIHNYLVFHHNIRIDNNKNWHSFPYLLIATQDYMRYYQSKGAEYGAVNSRLEKEKIFNCLNFAEHKHRTLIYNGLKDRGLLDKGFVSCVYKGVDLPRDIDPIKPYEEIYDPLQGKNVDDGWNIFCYHVVEKSFFGVVTETHHEIVPDNDGLHISEKTFKSVISQPFMVVGQYGVLQQLREWGFETYSELFDESYDLIENPMERINFILKEIDRLCNMDENNLRQIYDSVLWKVQHNRRVMLEFPTDDFSFKHLINYSKKVIVGE